jgi:hypothetical protein
MRPFKQKGILVITISISLIIAFGVANSFAQEKMKMKDKRYWVTTKKEMTKIDDAEGHIVMMTEAKAVDVSSGIVAVGKSTYDLINGNGNIQGYTTNKYPNGDSTFSKQVGKFVTTLSPQGKPMMSAEGTFTTYKGTGTMEGIQGVGTWKMKIIGEDVAVMDWEMEYTIKK